MNKDFIEAMALRSDKELMKILTIHRQEYQPEAVVCAENELKRRGFSTENLNKLENEVKTEVQQKLEADANIANSGLRLVHLIIDSIAIAWLTTMLGVILIFSIGIPFGANSWWIYLITTFSYFIFLEYKFGKSLGKLVTKTTVIKSNGENPTLSDIIIRTLCRFIPFDHFSYLFMKIGFHDYLSNTMVVKKKTNVR